jgi:membrane protein implicated in regulation of membrane protease activity
MNYMPFFWIAVIVLSVIAEVNTAALVAIWFMPSAIVATVLAFFNVPIFVQALVFTALSALFIIFSKTIFNKTLRPNHTPTNADAVIGETAIVTERICNIENKGLVKVRGQIWSARSADGAELEEGETVSVISIEGVKLICRK